MTRERACLACEGTGAAGGDRYAETARLDTPRGRRMQVALYFEARRNPCPACLGSGRQTDRITAQDAIADAETLRKARTLAPYPLWLSLQAAAFCGRSPVLFMEPASEHAWEIGRDAARAAFRAVPALKED